MIVKTFFVSPFIAKIFMDLLFQHTYVDVEYILDPIFYDRDRWREDNGVDVNAHKKAFKHSLAKVPDVASEGLLQ